ncbi:unnamed protein product [Allacma fusca]|uniref:BTB domain-containing protein n=1 Tax=Allacma fusca TaxID=39272 RepID=A0A8J2LC79_9HEXA|nr:unnamed protein product [Allacma fusca]
MYAPRTSSYQAEWIVCEDKINGIEVGSIVLDNGVVGVGVKPDSVIRELILRAQLVIAIQCGSNPRLFTISDNERQRLLSARVASILENSCKFEDYGVHLTQEKTIFPDIPPRLKVHREEESPLWRRASVPFEIEEEEEYLRKLTNSNQIKILELPCLRKSIEKTEVHSDVDSCDRGLDVVKVEEPAFDNSGSIFASDKNNATITDEIMDSSPEESSSTSSISKKFFPIFGTSQGNKRETGNFGSQANTSGMDDFETPKSKSKFSLWGSKKEKFAVKKSFSHEWKPPPLSKSDHKDLAQDLLALFLEKTDADVTVYGREEKPIRAHKLILKARCPKLLSDIVIDNNAKSERKRETATYWI